MDKLEHCLQLGLKLQKCTFLKSESIHLLKKLLQQVSTKEQSHLSCSLYTSGGLNYSPQNNIPNKRKEEDLCSQPLSVIEYHETADGKDADDVTANEPSLQNRDSYDHQLDNGISISKPQDNGYPPALKTVSVVPGKGKPPEPPVTCCGTGCANCVWIVYAEQLKEYYKDGGGQARKALDQIEDPSLKAFIKLELGL